ncbi:hypothetical protein G6O69_35690 [Pseudenhygromyxa sp. WMMC2535]|uniref:hypothetical protein n=1 Tax=Pseudenhygromyxa sp. WMMC2535 TaxID=2712867 RepID=UPI0015578E52|nr:hypothetical protein [Pseudenhygromyxa sp. WMMC2535]NVB43222.1 hypothetical protein [Pseudenhygromyxa sp. WMMC2535]
MTTSIFALALLSSLIEPEPVVDDPIEAEAQEEAGEVEGAEEGASGEELEPMPPAKVGKREWMLVVSPGFDYVVGPQKAYEALGGGFRLGGLATKWAGAKGHFLVGGGPMIHYTYLKDPDFQDVLHLATVNGDLVLGGGNQRWALYWHLTLGFGVLSAKDAQTSSSLTTFGARAASGIGGYGKINDRFSLGALVDFGWAGGLWVNTLLTANIHFGRRGDPL